MSHIPAFASDHSDALDKPPVAPHATGNRSEPDTPAGEPEYATVFISDLSLGLSPRLAGQNEAHVARLAETEGPLPPILVDRRTMQVIDGAHRLMAATLKGEETIRVEYFTGTPGEAFLHAVHANVTHGLPLSQSDRQNAAAQIIVSHPYMSDRAIAEVAGLGAKTVAAIRRRSEGAESEVSGRVGRDGRVRPLNAAEGRLKAAELIDARPHASLREIARRAGVSPATVGDVRRRLSRGEAPVPAGFGTAEGRESPAAGSSRATLTERVEPPAGPDPSVLLEKLVRDPSLRHKEDGRQLLRLLQQTAIDPADRAHLAAAVPSHCRNLVTQLARRYAQAWADFAQELEVSTQPMLRAVTNRSFAGRSGDADGRHGAASDAGHAPWERGVYGSRV